MKQAITRKQSQKLRQISLEHRIKTNSHRNQRRRGLKTQVKIGEISQDGTDHQNWRETQ